MKRTVLFASVTIVVGLACAPLRADEKKPEPKYEGKPLAYRVERLQKSEKDQEQKGAARAIAAFGPDAKPAVSALVEMLDDRSKWFRELVGETLCDLGPAAQEAVPALVRTLKDNTARSPDVVLKILGQVAGPEAKEAVRGLTKALRNEDPEDRLNAALGLWKIEKNGRLVVPVLTALLREYDFVASRAAEALGEIGPDARAAIPALRLAALAGRGMYLPSAAEKAIEKIDPEEAKKLKTEK